jgi:hypothetical protein
MAHHTNDLFIFSSNLVAKNFTLKMNTWNVRNSNIDFAYIMQCFFPTELNLWDKNNNKYSKSHVLDFLFIY